MNLASIWGLETTVIVFVLGIVFLSLVGLADSYSTLKEIFYLRRTPIMNINALPTEGLVQIIGKVEKATVTSPIKKKDCVAWQVEVQEERHESKGETYWDTVWKGTSTEPFELSGETGKIWVYPKGANLRLQQDTVSWGGDGETGLFHSLSPNTRDAITHWEIKTEDFQGSEKKFKVNEVHLSAGDDFYIFGMVDNSEKQKKMIKVDGSPFVISDNRKINLLTERYSQITNRLLWIILIGGFFLLLFLFDKPGSPK
jgi:hypothetical protein